MTLSGISARATSLGEGGRSRRAVRSDAVSTAASGLFVASLCVGVGAFIATNLGARVVQAILAFVLLAVIATRWSRQTVLLILATLVLVPYYALPNVGGQPLVPSAVFAWGAAVGLLVRGARIRFTMVDFLVATFVIGMVGSVVLGGRSGGDLFRELSLWLGPYFAMRLLAKEDYRWVACWLVRAAVLLTPFVIVEATTGANPFRHLNYNAAAAAVWASELERLNGVRPEASFGHPIALSMFLAAATVLSVALFVEARIRRARLGWGASAIAVGISLALTLSRTGLFALAVGLVVFLPATTATRRHLSVFFALGLLSLLLLVLPQAHAARDLLLSPLSGSHEIATSTEHRQQQLSAVVSGNVTLSTFGQHDSPFVGGIDNEYVVLGVKWGWWPMFAFLLLTPALLLRAIRGGQNPVSHALISVGIAMAASLVFVALITQQQVLVWLLLGSAAGVPVGAPWWQRDRAPVSQLT